MITSKFENAAHVDEFFDNLKQSLKAMLSNGETVAFSLDVASKPVIADGKVDFVTTGNTLIIEMGEPAQKRLAG